MGRTLIGNINDGKSPALNSINELLDLMVSRNPGDTAALYALSTAINNRVRFDAPQILTAQEKLTANLNIGTVGINGAGDPDQVAFEYQQLVPLSTWTISVPLSFEGRKPSVMLYDMQGGQVESDIFATPTMVVVTFPAPFAGTAILT